MASSIPGGATPNAQASRDHFSTPRTARDGAPNVHDVQDAASVDFVSARGRAPSVTSSQSGMGLTPLRQVEEGLAEITAPTQKAIGWRRHALQRATLAGGALGVVLACCGHPWGLVFAAIGMLAGAIVQHGARGRALERQQTKDFIQHFEAVRAEYIDANGRPFNAFSVAVVRSDAYVRAAKLHAFLEGGMMHDLRQAFVKPVAAFVRQIRGSQAPSSQTATQEALSSQTATPGTPEEVLHPMPPAP